MGSDCSGEKTVTTLVVRPDELRDAKVRVEGHAYRHLFRARRLTKGDVVRLVDGEGEARFGSAVEISATHAVFVLGGEAPSNEPSRYVELLAPVPKASRLSWMVEKATEIGVSAIRLIHTERAPRQVGSRTLDRLRRVAVAAVEQSGRSRVPAISGMHAIAAVPDLIRQTRERWFLHPGSTAVVSVSSRADTSLLVGPEGGWTESEVAELEGWGCQSWSLGPTVLRIETAAIVGTAGLLVNPLFK